MTAVPADPATAAGPEVRAVSAGRGGPGLEAAATAIGVTQDELRTALESGQSIADVAKSKGKDPQVVIDALVAAAKTRLDADVAAGRITQAEADTRLKDETDHITDQVNNVRPTPPAKPDAGSTTTTTS